MFAFRTILGNCLTAITALALVCQPLASRWCLCQVAQWKAKGAAQFDTTKPLMCVCCTGHRVKPKLQLPSHDSSNRAVTATENSRGNSPLHCPSDCPCQDRHLIEVATANATSPLTWDLSGDMEIFAVVTDDDEAAKKGLLDVLTLALFCDHDVGDKCVAFCRFNI